GKMKLRNLTAVAAVSSCVLTCGALQARADTFTRKAEECSSETSENRLAACRWIIQSGLLSGRTLASAYHNKGQAEDENRQHSAPIEDYTKALAITPNNPDILGDRALAHAEAGQSRQAIEDATAAITIHPADPLPYRTRGQTLIELGRISD